MARPLRIRSFSVRTFPSPETLQAALQHPTSAEVMNDVKNYYDGTPEIFFGEVVA
jgi:hypothetical protein